MCFMPPRMLGELIFTELTGEGMHCKYVDDFDPVVPWSVTQDCQQPCLPGAGEGEEGAVGLPYSHSNRLPEITVATPDASFLLLFFFNVTYRTVAAIKGDRSQLNALLIGSSPQRYLYLSEQ